MDWLWVAIDTEVLLQSLGLPAATLVYCFVSGFLPVFNTEVYLVGVSAFVGWAALPLLALMAGIGQIAAKTLVYGAGRGTLEVSLGRHEDKRERIVQRFDDHEGSTAALLFVSASVGFPPFYVVSGAAGALAVDVTVFLVSGLLGRMFRFGAILAAGSAALGWLL